ncbi:MAG: type 1 glutamine amidotransferase, partial [Verrucomicrobiae bacterium]|nr:type 1 glutamine amidotransferase [Verrucomicrobiae bacterium]
VRPNPKGREYGVAREITLTREGRNHSLLRGRPLVFDALSLHRDIVDPLPDSVMTVLAGNECTPVQAAELRLGDGVFWGVQYHPEYGFGDLAAAFRRYGARLLEDGFFAGPAELESTIGSYEEANQAGGGGVCPDLPGLGLGLGLLDARQRALEIHNWVDEVRRRAGARRPQARRRAP